MTDNDGRTLLDFIAPSDVPSTDVSEAHFAQPLKVDFQHQHGVRWQGPWQHDDSAAISTRIHARALAAAGVPTNLQSDQAVVMDGWLSQATTEEVSDLRAMSFKDVVVIVNHLIPTFERVLATVYPGQSLHFQQDMVEAVARSRILFTVWERSSVSPQIASIMKKFGMNWVPCGRNASMLKASGVRDVRVVPHPFEPHSPLPHIGRSKKRPESTVLFYTIAKWEPRKALHEALGAFLQEFRPGDPAQYALKTTEGAQWTDYPHSAAKSVLLWLDHPKVQEMGWTRENVNGSVRVITDKLPLDDIWRLHRVGHVYVSASHGEGFDMPAFDACLSRSRLIHTGWGGSEDYAPRDSIFTWDASVGEEPTHTDYKWFASTWAKVDMGRLRKAMRAAYEERTLGEQIDEAKYSFDSVGKLMRSLVEEVLASNGREVRW
jgi:hypothetical protein